MLLTGVTQCKFLHPQFYFLNDFIKDFELNFDLGQYFSDKELLGIASTVQFSYLNARVTDQRYKPAWTLSIDSIISNLKEPILQTYGFLEKLFNNYPSSSSNYFSVYFHRSSSSGINEHSRLGEQLAGKYDDKNDELSGTSFTFDRTDPQSVVEGINSIIYYMLKFNALVIVKEGRHSAPSAQTVVCLSQLRLYHPSAIQTLGSLDKELPFTLSQYSSTNYNNWEADFNKIFSVDTMHPIYAFHD